MAEPELTGLQLSVSKTEVLGISETRDMQGCTARLDLAVVGQIKFVIAFVTKQQGQIEDNLNFKRAFEQMRLVYRSWIWRNPSALGAAIISKSLMVSTMTHILTNFQPTAEHIQEYNTMIRRFIWRGRSQVQNRRLDQPLGRGGLGVTSMVDFTAALRIRWFKQICTKDKADFNWMIVLQHWLNYLDITIKDIPMMGFNDIKIMSNWFKEKGLLFWASTFAYLSKAQELWE
jgi:hypothetical protein